MLASILLSTIVIRAYRSDCHLPRAPRERQTPQGRVIGYFTEGGAASGKYPVKSIVTSGAAKLLTQSRLRLWPRSE